MPSKTRKPYIFPLVDEIDYDSFVEVQAQVLEAQAAGAQLVVRICTPGGNASAGLAIYDLLRATPGTITEAWGECMSVGVLVLMAGTERRASKNSRLMIHNSRSHIGQAVLTKEDFALHSKEHGRLDALYAETIATRSKLPFGKVESWAKAETYFTAKEALQTGLVDSIIIGG